MAQRPGRRRLIAYSAVGLFLLIDAMLITGALTSTSVDAAVDASSESAASASVFPTPSATTSATPARTAEPTVTPVPAVRLLSAASGTAAWRATTGGCPTTSAAPEFSTDSGATWITTDATGPTDVAALQSINALSESVAEFVGLDGETCAPQFVKTFVGGDNYSSYPRQLDTAWYVDPTDRSEVHGPDGFQPAPCDAIVALSAGSADDGAAVLCADARIFATTDAAASWSAPLTVVGALTLTATDGGYSAFAAGAATDGATPTDAADPTVCLGLSVIELSLDTIGGDLTATTSGCYVTDEAPAVLAGNIAVAAADSTLWLWIGDATVRSTDAGRTWL